MVAASISATAECPANVHRHDRPGGEIDRIAVNGFAVQVDVEPLPQPGFLTVDVHEIIITAAELEAFLQAASRDPLVIFRRADIEGESGLVTLLSCHRR